MRHAVTEDYADIKSELRADVYETFDMADLYRNIKAIAIFLLGDFFQIRIIRKCIRRLRKRGRLPGGITRLGGWGFGWNAVITRGEFGRDGGRLFRIAEKELSE